MLHSFQIWVEVSAILHEKLFFKNLKCVMSTRQLSAGNMNEFQVLFTPHNAGYVSIYTQYNSGMNVHYLNIVHCLIDQNGNKSTSIGKCYEYAIINYTIKNLLYFSSNIVPADKYIS